MVVEKNVQITERFFDNRYMGDRIRPAALREALSCHVKVADPLFLWKTQRGTELKVKED